MAVELLAVRAVRAGALVDGVFLYLVGRGIPLQQAHHKEITVEIILMHQTVEMLALVGVVQLRQPPIAQQTT
jgi:hypothetical protein